ncbi:unnamed protein product [Bursaphelenchus xylophilus]|uniref:Galectin n=1 Tax=Bursaphelenchus xylophilus TaxID=6326 RepID=A0A1I7SL39_BURXY|nr:unnamed protein product [Bursaphelenchus xylophilus]CAG9129358.1 unnamed protein product [Bursaphelenchus xylophilus]
MRVFWIFLTIGMTAGDDRSLPRRQGFAANNEVVIKGHSTYHLPCNVEVTFLYYNSFDQSTRKGVKITVRREKPNLNTVLMSPFNMPKEYVEKSVPTNYSILPNTDFDLRIMFSGEKKIDVILVNVTGAGERRNLASFDLNYSFLNMWTISGDIARLEDVVITEKYQMPYTNTLHWGIGKSLKIVGQLSNETMVFNILNDKDHIPLTVRLNPKFKRIGITNFANGSWRPEHACGLKTIVGNHPFELKIKWYNEKQLGLGVNGLDCAFKFNHLVNNPAAEYKKINIRSTGGYITNISAENI